ncbi:hypothetical protein AAVH_28874, partial [Aphelenchoides avenae]
FRLDDDTDRYKMTFADFSPVIINTCIGFLCVLLCMFVLIGVCLLVHASAVYHASRRSAKMGLNVELGHDSLFPNDYQFAVSYQKSRRQCALHKASRVWTTQKEHGSAQTVRRPSPYVACGCGCKCFPSLHSIVKCSRADALDVSDTSSNSSGSYNDGKSGNFPDEPPVPRALEVPALRHDFGGHSRSDSVTSSPCSGASLVRAKAPRARTVPPRTPTRR